MREKRGSKPGPKPGTMHVGHPGKPIVVDGVLYKTVKEAALAHKVSASTITRWAEKGRAAYVGRPDKWRRLARVMKKHGRKASLVEAALLFADYEQELLDAALAT